MAAPSGFTLRNVNNVDIPTPATGKFTVFGSADLPRVKNDMGNVTVLGNGIVSITEIGTVGLVTTYRITLQSGSFYDFEVADGRSIVSLVLQGTVGLVDTYRITFNDATTFDYTVTNAKSITGVALNGTVGLVDTYRITFNDGPAFDYNVTNAKSITSVTLLSTVGLVETYRITFNDGPPFDYNVSNGRSIVDIVPPVNPGQPGATDIYTIQFNDGPNETFIVYNGIDGTGNPAVNNPTTIDPDDAAAIGTRTNFFALEDHQHAIMADAAVGLNGGSTNTEGTGTAFARNDHTHAIANGGTPSTIQPDAAAAQGTSTSLARSDHVHAIVADVAVGLNGGSTNTEGTGTAFARNDHTHAIANGGTPSTVSNTTAAQGTSTSLARSDHVHAVSSGAAVTLNGGSTNTAGTATTLALSDHTHAITNGGTPSTIQPDATAAQGTSTSLARSDHVHAIVADVPVALGAANAEGTSTSFARADHVHLNPVIAHEAAADPHPQYTTTAEAAAAAPVQSVAAGTGISVNATTGNVVVTNAGVTSVSVNGGAAQTGAVSVTTPSPANAAPPAVAATSSTGTATTEYALEDHTHAGVTSVNTRQGAVTLTSADVGLGNVINPVAPNVHTVTAQALTTTLATVATMTIPANSLTAGTAFEIDVLFSTLVNTTAASNLEVAIFLNGTQNAIAVATMGTTAVAAPGRGGRSLFKLVFRTVGAAGTAIANGTIHVNNIANFASNNAAVQTVNTTANITLDVRARTSAATTTGQVQFVAIDQAT